MGPTAWTSPPHSVSGGGRGERNVANPAPGGAAVAEARPGGRRPVWPGPAIDTGPGARGGVGSPFMSARLGHAGWSRLLALTVRACGRGTYAFHCLRRLPAVA